MTTQSTIAYALEAIQWAIVGVLIGVPLRQSMFRRGDRSHRRAARRD